MSLLQAVLVVVDAVAASVLLPPMAWLLARTYRRSAAGRRLVWIIAFAMLLGLPLLAVIAPSLTVIGLPAPLPLPAAPPVVATVASTPQPGPSGLSWFVLIPIAFAVWLAGLAKLGAEHLFALARLELMRRRATPWRGPTPVPVRGCALLMSEDCPGPMTWGVVRPVIMLPDEAFDWPADRLATVLRHEMAHVRRRDGLAQALAVIACALYWPNPLVWAAARALRREAELAADDAVIAAGVKPSDYAGQLLELAAEWRERRLTPTGLAMAAPPALSQRVQSILSTDAIRTGATAMDTWKLVLLGGAATAALTLARPSVAEVPAPSAPASLQAQEAAPATPAAKAAVSRGQLAQQAAPTPPAPSAAPAPTPVLVPGQAIQVPYNQVTDDPASPGFIPAGQPGAGHPVPADLAKLLNARKGSPNQPWTLAWCPAGTDCPQPPMPPGAAAPPLPATPAAARGARPFSLGWIGANGAPPPAVPPLPGAPGAVTIFGDSTGNGTVNVNGSTYNFRGMTAEQRAELQRKLAAIGPAINKAIADAHIDETVQNALASQDPKIREAVAKQLADLGPRIQSAVAAAHMQEDMQQRLAQIPQYQEAMQKIRARQADAEDQAAARLEEQAKLARERAKRDRDSLHQQSQSPQTPKN